MNEQENQIIKLRNKNKQLTEQIKRLKDQNHLYCEKYNRVVIRLQKILESMGIK